jgi:predicted GNAT family acetyltransferase
MRFRDNTAEQRYELDAPEGLSFADYRDAGGVRVLPHVETDPNARGLGYAAKLMEAIVVHARAEGLKLRPRCGYAVAWFARQRGAADDVLA